MFLIKLKINKNLNNICFFLKNIYYLLMKKIIDIRVLIPNLITLIAICAGLGSIRFAFEGNFKLAIIAVLVAALLDGLDGRVARALNATSQFGAELDSLADAINFGVVPALILYIWDLKNLGNFGWLACLLYVIAVVLRLARFNVMDLKSSDIFLESSDAPQITPHMPRAYFIGVPAPVAAILVLLPIYLSLVGGANMPKIIQSIEAVYVIVIASFTISTLKTFSLKAMRFSRTSSLTVMFGVAVTAALFFSYTWLGLVILCLLYLSYLFLASFRSIMRYYKFKKSYI
jgi:CDP-diacylglycerol---serine O-phosphatidyltransferase